METSHKKLWRKFWREEAGKKLYKIRGLDKAVDEKLLLKRAKGAGTEQLQSWLVLQRGYATNIYHFQMMVGSFTLGFILKVNS